MMMHEPDDFKDFVEFLISTDVCNEPIRGDLRVIGCLFDTLGTGKTVDNFTTYLNEFNELSGDALVIKNDKLEWINMATIHILNDRLGGVPPSHLKLVGRPKKAQSTFEELKEIIDGPLHVQLSQGFEHAVKFHTDYTMLDTLLRKPRAYTVLAKERAHATTVQKPFFEVCSNLRHSETLARICLKLDFKPDFATAHTKINQNKGLLPKEIYNCSKTMIHYLPIYNGQTDLSLGDCSYLDTCHKLKSCRYLHYHTLNPSAQEAQPKATESNYTIGESFNAYKREQLPRQWINCDVRYLPFPILGKFAAIISDPAWDIHMSLPYGTCKDVELLSLPMKQLQDEGIIMLWVTGRSIEIGRKALLQWGYEISDEMLWIKLNQLLRTIVTGRTGHWLNHSKEHLLVGVKGNPIWLNRKIDMDIVVSWTRETLRKPDEIYDIVERMVGKHARKLEIFGRDHNTRPGWLTIGNQLQGTSIHEKDVQRKYNDWQKSSKTSSYNENLLYTNR